MLLFFKTLLNVVLAKSVCLYTNYCGLGKDILGLVFMVKELVVEMQCALH